MFQTCNCSSLLLPEVSSKQCYANNIGLLKLECCRRLIPGLLTCLQQHHVCFLYTLNHKKSSGLKHLSQETSKRRASPVRIPALGQRVSCLNITFHKNGFFLLAHKNILCIDVLWIKNNKKHSL